MSPIASEFFSNLGPRHVQQAIWLLLAVSIVQAYPGYQNQRFFYQVPGVEPLHPQLQQFVAQSDTRYPSLIYQNHLNTLQSNRRGQNAASGGLVYLLPQEGAGETTGSQGGGYIDSFFNFVGNYWPGSVGQPESNQQQQPSNEVESSTDDKTDEKKPTKPITASAQPLAPSPQQLTSSVVKQPQMPIVVQENAAPSLAQKFMAAPAVRTPIRHHQMIPAGQQQNAAFRLPSMGMGSFQQDFMMDNMENDMINRKTSGAVDFQRILSAARFKATQAAIRAAMAEREAAAAATQEDQDQDEDSKDTNASSDNENDPEPLGPSIAQAKPQAVSVAGLGGVAAAAPVGTAVVGPGGMALSAPHATAVAGAGKKQPAPGNQDEKMRIARLPPIRRIHADPSYFMSY